MVGPVPGRALHRTRSIFPRGRRRPCFREPLMRYANQSCPARLSSWAGFGPSGPSATCAPASSTGWRRSVRGRPPKTVSRRYAARTRNGWHGSVVPVITRIGLVRLCGPLIDRSASFGLGGGGEPVGGADETGKEDKSNPLEPSFQSRVSGFVQSLSWVLSLALPQVLLVWAGAGDLSADLARKVLLADGLHHLPGVGIAGRFDQRRRLRHSL